MISFTEVTMSEYEDDHYNDTEDHDHHNEVFNKFHPWIQVPSIFILIFVIGLGTAANSFIVYCVWKKKIGTDVINPILIGISAKNLLATGTCIPTAMVMLTIPGTIVKTMCHIQENITLVVLFAGFLFPALLSAVQCDHIRRPFGRKRKAVTIRVLITIVSLTASLLGVQGLFVVGDTHGCHLWSRRVDSVILSVIYTITSAAFISFTAMGTSYFLIYFRTSTHENAVRNSSNVSNPFEVNSAPNVHRAPPLATSNRNNRGTTTTTTAAILKPMFCIVFTNFLFSLPWQVLYGLTISGKVPANLDELRILAMCIIYIPIATDPVLFLAFSTKGRRAIRTFCKRSRVSPQNSESLTHSTLVSTTQRIVTKHE